jgi:type IV pilus assembly protein PilX
MTPIPLSSTCLRRAPRGFALITALMVLVMLTLLALSMFHSFGLQQKIAGNTREKERSLQAAQSALQYGEWWLSQANLLPGDLGVPCTNTTVIAKPTDMRLCNAPLATPGNLSTWTGASIYTPPNMIVLAGGGLATDGNSQVDINYAKAPQVQVAYIGKSADKTQLLYSVTASGYGGTPDTATVVQSIYAFPGDDNCCDKP